MAQVTVLRIAYVVEAVAWIAGFIAGSLPTLLALVALGSNPSLGRLGVLFALMVTVPLVVIDVVGFMMARGPEPERLALWLHAAQAGLLLAPTVIAAGVMLAHNGPQVPGWDDPGTLGNLLLMCSGLLPALAVWLGTRAGHRAQVAAWVVAVVGMVLGALFNTALGLQVLGGISAWV